jgi:hypothetical protein
MLFGCSSSSTDPSHHSAHIDDSTDSMRQDGDAPRDDEAPPNSHESDVELGCPNVPFAPALSQIRAGETLRFVAPTGGVLRVGLSEALDADVPWLDGPELALPDEAGAVFWAFAEVEDTACSHASFAFAYELDEEYDGPATGADTLALHMDDVDWAGWASALDDLEYGDEAAVDWRTPERALGEATGEATDVVSLGEGGFITHTYDAPILDGDGADIAVNENSINDTF